MSGRSRGSVGAAACPWGAWTERGMKGGGGWRGREADASRPCLRWRIGTSSSSSGKSGRVTDGESWGESPLAVTAPGAAKSE